MAKSMDETLVCDHEMKATGQYSHFVVFLYLTVK